MLVVPCPLTIRMLLPKLSKELSLSSAIQKFLREFPLKILVSTSFYFLKMGYNLGVAFTYCYGLYIAPRYLFRMEASVIL